MDWLSASKHFSEYVNNVANAINLREVCKKCLVEVAADSRIAAKQMLVCHVKD